VIVESLVSAVWPSYSFPVHGIVEARVYIKCEALNIAGSIKLKPALRMIDDLEQSGRLTKRNTLIESSSGNLGIAVSMIAASRGYRFVCVTDPNAADHSVRTMRALGSEVIVVTEKDGNGGYLGSRIKFIEAMRSADPKIVWLNQYANDSNWRAHFDTTAPEILSDFPKVDYLFIGTGTAGTLMGCCRYFRAHSPATRIVAVDVEGSVAFGGAPKTRRIPGIGTSRRPELLDDSLVDSVVHVSELETIRTCRRLASRGLLLGGSTGAVLAAIKRCGNQLSPDDIVVTVMPDLGFKYIETIYCDTWTERYFGPRTRQVGTP
jgi:N-(2-amino-2-carboxyethyl)-L-glutamate synthase